MLIIRKANDALAGSGILLSFVIINRPKIYVYTIIILYLLFVYF